LTDQPNPSTATPRLSFKKKFSFTLILMLVAALLALAISELYIRRTSKLGYVTPEILKNRSVQYVPSLFARHVFPQKDLVAYGGEGPTGSVFYHINEKGYRGHNFESNKPAGKTRIIFYGGSNVFDIWMPEDEDWPHKIESILNANGFPEVEVINAGIPGHASFDSVGRLWSEGHTFHPDYVVYCGAWNDMKKHFRFAEPLLRQMQPYPEDSDPRLNYQGRLDRFLSEHFQLFVRVRQKYYDWKLNADLEGEAVQRDGTFDFDVQEEALTQYKLNIQLFVDCAKDIGAVPVLMTEARLAVRANEDQLAGRSWDETLLTAYERVEQILTDVARDKNAVLVDASKELNGRREFFTDRVHLTERGSHELAGLVAHGMARLLKERK
jgi:lysophospholipase L1-like esterase